MDPQFERIAVIGLGLIGGSIAAGIKARGLASHVVAFDTNPVSLEQGLEKEVIDSAADSIAAAVEGAGLVVLCVPVLAMESVFGELKTALAEHPEMIVTDVGSVKCAVFDAARIALGEVPANLVPGHPIAGSERHGVRASNPNLFTQHKIILTPRLTTNGEATRQVRELWQGLEAEVVEMDPEHHDIILAQTSHLPHLLAFALVDTLSAQGDSMEIFEYAAGGFRDFTRIAASDPVMWRDVFASNSGPVLDILDRYMEDLAKLRKMISEGESEELAAVFTRSKTARDHFSMLMAQRDIGRKK